MKKLFKIDKFLKDEPKNDPKWVRVVHAIRAAMREKELSTNGKDLTDAATRKVIKDRHLDANIIYV